MKRRIVPGGILALSLAVVIVAATASTASTTPTPPAPPLTFSVAIKDRLLPGYRSLNGSGCCFLLRRELRLRADASNDSTLVFGGDLKRTTKQLAAGEGTKFTAKLTQSKWKELKEEEEQAPKPVRLKAKIRSRRPMSSAKR